MFIAGFTGVLGQLIELDPVVLVWHRMTWAAALMALFLFIKKEMRHFRFKDMARMGGVGMLLCLHWIFFYASIKASNVSNGVVCFSLVGFFTALLEPIINRHRFSVREFLFSILTVCGVYLIFHFDTRYRLGIALGIVSSALYALFAIANQHVGKHYEAKNMLFWAMVGGIVVLSVILPVGKFLPTGMDYSIPIWPLWWWFALSGYACCKTLSYRRLTLSRSTSPTIWSPSIASSSRC